MNLWDNTVTVFRKEQNGYQKRLIVGCFFTEKTQYEGNDGVMIRQKRQLCRIPQESGYIPQIGDVIALGDEPDVPVSGKEGRFIESHRAFLVCQIKDNTLANVLPHYRIEGAAAARGV